MKVHQFARVFWEREPTSPTLACKRLRPLAPKITSSSSAAPDLKSFIRPETGPTKNGSSDYPKKESTHQTEVAGGGSRWNPTQEQIGMLEMLYQGGMRMPNARQIEQITAQLVKYGKIEGKNVFYWFQNHKARERQKQKRITLRSTPPSEFSTSPPAAAGLVLSPGEELDCSSQKRKSRSWGAFDQSAEEDRTLKLFPLHPEGRS